MRNWVRVDRDVRAWWMSVSGRRMSWSVVNSGLSVLMSVNSVVRCVDMRVKTVFTNTS